MISFKKMPSSGLTWPQTAILHILSQGGLPTHLMARQEKETPPVGRQSKGMFQLALLSWGRLYSARYWCTYIGLVTT